MPRNSFKKQVLKLLTKIMEGQEQLQNDLNEANQNITAVKGTLNQVGIESAASLQKITDLNQLVIDLQTQIANGGTISPELQELAKSVKENSASALAQAKVVDDLVPTPPPAEEPVPPVVEVPTEPTPEVPATPPSDDEGAE